MDNIRWAIYDEYSYVFPPRNGFVRFENQDELLAHLRTEISEETVYLLVNPSAELIRELKSAQKLLRAHLLISGTDSKTTSHLYKRGILFDRVWEKVWLPSEEFASERTATYRDRDDLRALLDAFAEGADESG